MRVTTILVAVLVILMGSGCAKGTLRLSSYGARVGEYRIAARVLSPPSGMFPMSAGFAGLGGQGSVGVAFILAAVLAIDLVWVTYKFATAQYVPPQAGPIEFFPPGLYLTGWGDSVNNANSYVWISNGVTGVFIED